MDELKFNPGELIVEKFNEISFEILTKKVKGEGRKMVGETTIKRKTALSSLYPEEEEAKYYAELFAQAPRMAEDLIAIRSQLIDEGMKEDSRLIKGIDNRLKPFLK